MTIWERLKMAWNALTQKPIEVQGGDTLINSWLATYKGAGAWLDYKYRTVDGRTRTRKRLTLNVAKVVCQELNNLAFSERPEIHTDDYVKEALDANDFFKNLTDLSEFILALGGGALKVYYRDGIQIDFVKANNFVPLSWDHKGITEASFLDRRIKDGKQYTRVETHKKVEAGYEITHELFDEHGKKITLSTVYPDLKETELVKVQSPLFAYIKTPISNNLNPESPLGISLFANATDTLKALDTAFDSLHMEMVLGKKRIIVPENAIRQVIDPETGKAVRYFDPADEVFVALSIDEDNKLQIQDNSVELRIDEIRLAIQTLLDILSMQIGFSQGYLAFDGTQVKTATEVISDNSRTFKTKTSYENELADGIKSILNTIREVGRIYNATVTNDEYMVVFEDSVIEDRNSKAAYWSGLYASGLIPLTLALQKIHGISEEDAEKMAETIKAEAPAPVYNSELFGGW